MKVSSLNLANGVSHYNLRNPSMQLPIIKHEFPKQSLIKILAQVTTLNEMSAETIELAKNDTQKRLSTSSEIL